MRNALLTGCIIFILWGCFRYFFTLSNGWEEIIIKPLLFLPIIFIFNFVLEKRKSKDLGIVKQGLTHSAVIGFLAAVGLILYKLFIVSLRTHSFTAAILPMQFNAVLWNIAVSFATAFCEEIVFRGYIQQRIFSEGRNIVTAIAVSNFFFVMIHLPRALFILHMSSFDLLSYLILLSFLGIINSILLWRTKNIATPIVTHWVWNFVTTVMR